MRLLLSTLVIGLGLVSQAAAETCVPLGWNQFLDAGEQTFEVVETVGLSNGTEMHGVMFDELTGLYAKLYLFLQTKGECDLRIVSLGSYSITHMYGDGAPVYHLDLYEPDAHSTLGFYEDPPSYDEIRTIARDIFAEAGG